MADMFAFSESDPVGVVREDDTSSAKNSSCDSGSASEAEATSATATFSSSVHHEGCSFCKMYTDGEKIPIATECGDCKTRLRKWNDQHLGTCEKCRVAEHERYESYQESLLEETKRMLAQASHDRRQLEARLRAQVQAARVLVDHFG